MVFQSSTADVPILINNSPDVHPFIFSTPVLRSQNIEKLSEENLQTLEGVKKLSRRNFDLQYNLMVANPGFIGVTEDMKVQHYVPQKKIIVQGVNLLRQQKTQVISNRAIRLVKDVNRFRLVCFKPVMYDPVTDSVVEWKSGWKDKEWKSVVRKCCQNGIDDEGKQYVKRFRLYWRLYSRYHWQRWLPVVTY
jgi:hypothetical protein